MYIDINAKNLGGKCLRIIRHHGVKSSCPSYQNCLIIITMRMSVRLVVDLICDRGRDTQRDSGRQTP